MKLQEYVNCYKVREETDPKTGKKRKVSEYVGPWFTTQPEALQRLKRRVLPFYLAALAIFAATGFLGSCRPLASAWPAAGYLFCVLPLLYMIPCVVRAKRLEAKFTLIDKEDTLRTLRNAAAGLGLFAILWAAAGVIVLVGGGFGSRPLMDVLFVAAGAAESALGWLLSRAADVPVHEVFSTAAFEKEEQA